MWDNTIYNIFAEIYLFFEKIDSVRKNLLYDDYNFVKLKKKFENIELLDLKNELKRISVKENPSKIELQYLLEVLLVIDYNLAEKINNNNINLTKPLNTVHLDKIKLFPKYNNYIEKRSGTNNIFSSRFKNLFPIIFNQSNQYNIINHYIDNYEDNDELVVATIPMSNIINDKSEKYLYSLKRALDDGANVIFSSEYSGSTDLDSKIYDTIINYHNLYFMFTPSHESNGANITKIFYKENNLIKTCEYKKHFPYTEKGKVVEDILYENPIFHLFHVKGIGMFCLVICKDFFSTKTEDFINQTQLDGIFVMAMTNTYSQFSSKSSMYVMHKRIVLLCNDCSKCIKNDLKSPIFYCYYVKKNGMEKNENSSCIEIKCNYKCTQEYCYFLLNLKNDNKKIVLKDFEHKVG